MGTLKQNMYPMGNCKTKPVSRGNCKQGYLHPDRRSKTENLYKETTLALTLHTAPGIPHRLHSVLNISNSNAETCQISHPRHTAQSYHDVFINARRFPAPNDDADNTNHAQWLIMHEWSMHWNGQWSGCTVSMNHRHAQLYHHLEVNCFTGEIAG